MAGRSSVAQVETMSSGREAPSRKLKAERACSSTYSMGEDLGLAEFTDLRILGTLAQQDIKKSQFRSSNPIFRIDLIVSSFHQPLPAKQVSHQTIKDDAVRCLQRNIPLVARPCVRLPPVAGRAPWSGLPDNVSRNFFLFETSKMGGLAVT